MTKQTADVKFPTITVRLSGVNGNAFSIIGAVSAALRRGGATADDIKAFQKEAMSGDYDHVIQTAMAYVEVE